MWRPVVPCLSAKARHAPEASGSRVATASAGVGERYEMARHATMTQARMTVKLAMTARARARPNTLAQCEAMTAEETPVSTPPATSTAVCAPCGTMPAEQSV